MNTFITYIKETRAELTHVAWPTRSQAIAFTALTIAVSLFVAAYLGAFDWVFAQVLQLFI